LNSKQKIGVAVVVGIAAGVSLLSLQLYMQHRQDDQFHATVMQDARKRALREDLERESKVPSINHPCVYQNQLKIRLEDGRVAVITLTPYWTRIAREYGYGPYGLPAVCCDAAAMRSRVPFPERTISVWVGDEGESVGIADRQSPVRRIVRIRDLGDLNIRNL